MKTNYDKVVDFNKCFGSLVSNVLNPSLFKSNPKLVDLKYSLISEEVSELIDAYNNDDIVEIIDALSDIKYVLHGMASAFGINMNIVFTHYLDVYVSYIKNSDGSNFNIINSHYNFNNHVKNYKNNIKIENFKKNLDEFIIIIENVNKDFINIIETCNIDSLIINLCKLLYYVNKMGAYIGINLDETFKIVHDSNMSKVCESEELAKKTVDWYLENDNRYKTPTYRKSEFGWIVYNEDSGKILKSIKYIPAEFAALL
jgi:predicted HAD superfamily Cof-like phosphohydrolase